MEQQPLVAYHTSASVMEGNLGNTRHGGVQEIRGLVHATQPADVHQRTTASQPPKTTGHAQTPSHLTDPPQPHEHKAETRSRTPTKEFTNGTDRAFSFTHTCRVIEQQVCSRGLYRCSQFCDSSVIAIVPNISTERLAITGIMATI